MLKELDVAKLIAMWRWNAEADEYNQWQELGQDEKDKLIGVVLEEMQ